MTRNQSDLSKFIQINFGQKGRINSGTYNGTARKDFTPTSEEMQALKEWADPEKRAEIERKANSIIEGIGSYPHH